MWEDKIKNQEYNAISNGGIESNVTQNTPYKTKTDKFTKELNKRNAYSASVVDRVADDNLNS